MVQFSTGSLMMTKGREKHRWPARGKIIAVAKVDLWGWHTSRRADHPAVGILDEIHGVDQRQIGDAFLKDLVEVGAAGQGREKVSVELMPIWRIWSIRPVWIASAAWRLRSDSSASVSDRFFSSRRRCRQALHCAIE